MLKAIRGLAGSLFKHEILDISEAAAMLKKPREGKGIPAFLRAMQPTPTNPAKKPRMEAEAESGPHISLLIQPTGGRGEG